MKLLNLINSKGRDAHIEYFPTAPKKQTLYITNAGQSVSSKRMVKSTVTAELLIQKAGSPSVVSQLLTEGDPEVDMETIGKYAAQTTRVYVNQNDQFIFNIHQKEMVYDFMGKLVDERKPKYMESTVGEESPLRTTRWMPRQEIYNKFVFVRKYQIKHVNSLTYDFLYEMVKELHDKQSFLLLGTGPKGAGPLVFENGGKPYRAFLEGRVDGERYLLLLHLSNLELKPLPIDK